MKSKNALCGLAMAVVLQVGMLASITQAQNLFVESGGSILEFTPGGAQSTFASGLSPYGLAFDSAGNLFEADTGSGNIYEFTNGVATEKGTFASGLPFPIALAFNSAGNLFVTTYYGNIYKFTPGGAQSFFAGGLGMGSAVALAFDSSNNLFVANSPEFPPGNIYEITPGGAVSNFVSGLNGPAGVAFDSAGDLFEADNGSGNIYEFTNGVATEMGTFASGLNHPGGLAFDSAGNLFEADVGSGNIYEFTPGGMRSTFATGLSGGQVYLAFQPLHALAIILSGPNVILTWPTNVTGTLQFTTNLVSPALWNTNMPSPVVVNGQNAVTNPISGSQMFFRLFSP
jgi:sugar lactone lactonase YvrE